MSTRGVITGLLDIANAWVTYRVYDNPPDVPTAPKNFRPPQWGVQQSVYLKTTLPSQDENSSPTAFFFDAVMRVDHKQEVVLTDHPVQSGASITDHAYTLPARLSLEIGFSDVLDTYRAGQYTGGSSKSVSAFQTFQQIKNQRLPCTVTTRLNTYQNMLIEDIISYESAESIRGWRASLRFREIILGTVATKLVSSRPNSTNSSDEGTLSPQTPPISINQFNGGNGQWNSNSNPN